MTRLKIAIAVMALMVASSARADSVTLTLDPGSHLVGLPGQTVGWGYTVTNDSDNYFAWTTLNLDGFTDGNGRQLLTLPILRPHETAGEAYSFNPDPDGWSTGLFEFTWSPTVANGTTNAGTFTLVGDWYAPSAVYEVEGWLTVYDGSAPMGEATATADYSVTAVPEPATIGLVAIGLGAIVRRRTSRSASNQPR